MYTIDALQNYPEWYIAETDAAKTIQKLSNIKELSVYLKNTNEYIRRLAVLRVNELKLKDSVNILKDMLDDTLETSTNKELAAWTIKCIICRWNIELFISHRLLSKYTGSEEFSDTFGISIIDQSQEVKFNFQQSLINAQLYTDICDARSNECTNIEFSFFNWANEWFHELKLSLKKFFLEFSAHSTAFFKKVPGMFLKYIFNGIKRKPSGNIMIGAGEKGCACENNVSQSNIHSIENLRVKDSNYYMSKSSMPLSHIKTFIIKSLYVIFSPLRLVKRHRKLAAAIFMAAYIYFTFTAPGKLFTYKNFGVDIEDAQLSAFNCIKEIFLYAIDEAADIMGLNTPPDNISQSPDMSQPIKKYMVIAKGGLNLRKEPTLSSTEKILEYNSVVTYMSKSIQDDKGLLWYFVKDEDGKSGWVCSKWLREIGGEDNE